MAAKRWNYIRVSPGSVVRLDRARDRSLPEENQRVVEVEERYGIRHGIRQSPLLTLMGIDGTTRYIDNNFVSSVVGCWSPFPAHEKRRPQNIFRDKMGKFTDPSQWRTETRGEWFGPLDEMVRAVAAQLDKYLPRDINRERTVRLYLTQHCPGAIRKERILSCYAVHIKPFRRWVERNIYRLMLTVGELEERATEQLRRDDAQMQEDMDRMDEMFEKQDEEALDASEQLIPDYPWE